MKIFRETKSMVDVEQRYTRKILKNLMVIKKQKLYADLKYPSLHKYLTRELHYSEAEATLRVNAVRLMNYSKPAEEKVMKGDLWSTNPWSKRKRHDYLEASTNEVICENQDRFLTRA